VQGTPKRGWPALPAEVHASVVAALGAEVVDDTTLQGGFTPGVACRLSLADGSEVFVKAADASADPASAGMHRREAVVLAVVGADPAVPALRARVEVDGWVVLVTEHVAGSVPELPWTRDALAAVGVALAGLHERRTPAGGSPGAGFPPLSSLVDHPSYGFDRWRRFRSDPARAARHGLTPDDVDALAGAEAELATWAAGDTLLHGDLRADQFLVSDDQVHVVDWPHACTGPAWIDAALLLPSVLAAGGGFTVDEARRCLPELGDAPERGVVSLLAGFVGYLLWQSDEPPIPNLPTVRAYQRDQAVAALPWLLAAVR
jgi:fructosamine-3-kinase